MRDRLIELIRKARKKMQKEELTSQLAREYFIAEYLLANGVIVPPCKVEDTVYMPWEWGGTKGVAILTINRIVVDFTDRPYVNTNFFSDDEEYWLAYNCGRFNFNDFGKTVFLTKKEAEAALVARSGK